MSAIHRNCGSCSFLGVTPDEDGKRRIRRTRAYRCLWVPIDHPILAHSITMAAWYVTPENLTRRFMAPDDGDGCPVWKERTHADVLALLDREIEETAAPEPTP